MKTTLRHLRVRLAKAGQVLAAAFLIAVTPDGLAQDAARFRAVTLPQIAALQAEKDARTPAQQKLDSHLLQAAKERRDGFVLKEAPRLKADLVVSDDGKAPVDITATVSAALLSEIGSLGGTVINSFPDDHAIRALVPLTALETLAAREDVRFIQPAIGFTTNVGSKTSEGDVAHRANTARSAYGVDGTGIKVGVMSDSVDFLGASQSLGDLGTVTVISGQSGAGKGEGTAMLEIVHDLAPGAPLYFATANGGPAQMAANIRSLRAAGCRVIVDDFSYFNESPFQDGPIARAVNEVSGGGALYFSSARNSGNKNDGTSGTWEGDFADGGDAGSGRRFHAFSPGVTAVSVNAGGSDRRLDLFWSDPLGSSSNDYDLYVYDASFNVVRSSTTSQTGTQDPYENVGTLNPGEYIAIVKKASAAARFLHLDTGRGVINISTANSVRGHNASGAPNAFCVAATSAAGRTAAFTGSANNPVETFSSDGLRRVFYTPEGAPITPGNVTSTGGRVLQKPDLTAADGVVTSLPSSTGLNPFYGTSAAAPHAAAIATLVLSYRPGFTPAQVRSALVASRLDIEAAGVDRDSGAGIVMALGALQAAATTIEIKNDFNGDGKSDFIWENGRTGDLVAWFMNGGDLIAQTPLAPYPQVDPNWKIRATGDFDNDGKPDLVWENDVTGDLVAWIMSGSTLNYQLGFLPYPKVDPNWKIMTSGDFNSDGTTDLIWENVVSGDLVAWIMNGATVAYQAGFSPYSKVDPSWKIVGSGDFNGDKKPDLVWENDVTGGLVVWFMDGTKLISQTSFSPYGQVDPSWKIKSIADLNLDGQADIVWENDSNGALVAWIMNGLTLSYQAGFNPYPRVDPSWKIRSR